MRTVELAKKNSVESYGSTKCVITVHEVLDMSILFSE